MELDLLQQILDTPWMLRCAIASVLVAVAVVAAFWGLFRRIQTELFLEQIKKLMLAHNPCRAVKLCNAAPKSWVARLVLAMLGLEIPGRGPAPGQEAKGYREAAPALDFAEALRTRVAAEQARLRGEVNRLYGVALVLMVAALVAGIVALRAYLTTAYVDLTTLRYWPFVVTLIALLGAALTARSWRKERAALETTVGVMLPLLRPAEEMDEEGRKAAVMARKRR